jgi:hypothetical protein
MRMFLLIGAIAVGFLSIRPALADVCVNGINTLDCTVPAAVNTDRRFNHMRPSIAPRMRPQSA